MGTAIPRAGGTFAFVNRAFAAAAGAVTGLSILVSLIVALALMCCIIGEYLSRVGVDVGTLGPGWLGLAVPCSLCLINATGTRLSASRRREAGCTGSGENEILARRRISFGYEHL